MNNDSSIVFDANSEITSRTFSSFVGSDPDFVEGDIVAEMISLIKDKVNSDPNFRGKIHWLTFAPVTWSIETLKTQFNITYKVAKYAKNIQNLQGFGSYPPTRIFKTFPSNTIEQVINF